MRLIIDIPEKEFGIDIDDKFKGFFSRLKVEIKEHLMNNASLVCGAYELETIDMFLDAFKNATPLPEHHGRLIDADDIRVIELEDSLHIIRHEKGDDIDVYIDAPIIIERETKADE